jgi:hypothetical protein
VILFILLVLLRLPSRRRGRSAARFAVQPTVSVRRLPLSGDVLSSQPIERPEWPGRLMQYGLWNLAPRAVSKLLKQLTLLPTSC